MVHNRKNIKKNSIVLFFVKARQAGIFSVCRICICIGLLLFSKSYSSHQGPIAPIASGYGSDSTLIVRVDSIPSHCRSRRKLYLYHPQDIKNPVPAVFFLQGMGVPDKSVYEHLLHHIASRGLFVIMPDYTLSSFPYQRRTYEKLLSELIYGVRKFQLHIDTTRIGFAGHSFGAGAIPAMAWNCVKNKGWGGSGCFMFLMAPFYMFEMAQSRLEQFPPHVNLIIQVYEEDDCNDHRIAKDIFKSINIPLPQKDFIILLSDSSATAGYKLTADHAAPFSDKENDGETDAMDFYGIFRPLDALADYTFHQSPEAREIALGNGSTLQKYMGTWPDGRAVREPIVSDDPAILHPIKYYYFHWNHPWNLRNRVMGKQK